MHNFILNKHAKFKRDRAKKNNNNTLTVMFKNTVLFE